MTVRKSDDAVSPVIGVMLIMVVTVIIAAVVAAFATGMVGENSGPAPSAKMDVEIYSAFENQYGTYPTMTVSHISGEPLATKDLKLTFSWDCDGEECISNTPGHHSSTYKYETDGRWGTYTDYAGAENLFGGISGAFSPMGYKGGYVQPLYINYGDGMTSQYGGEFFGGDFILERGMTMRAYDLHLKTGTNSGNPAMDALFNNGNVITSIPVVESEYSCDYCGAPLVYQAEDQDMGWMYLPAGWYCSDPYQTYCMGTYSPFESYDPPEDDDDGVSTTGLSTGIMTCLPQGTAVKVSIIHIPTNKAIYTETVYVQ